MKQQAIALMYLLVFGPAAADKLSQSDTPAWFIKQFEPTVLGLVPAALPLQFYGLGVLEGVIAILMLVSLLKKESTKIFQLGLALSFAAFLALSFGQRISHKFDGAAELFFYASFTFLIYNSFFKNEKVLS